MIVTEDKDMGQLVSGHVQLFSTRLEKFIEANDVLMLHLLHELDLSFD